MKNKLALIFLLLVTIACYAKEPTETCSISGDDLKYILSMYDDLQEYPLYVFENNTKKLKEIEEAAKSIDFETCNPKEAKEAAWYLFYRDFANGRSYNNLLNLSDYEIKVRTVDKKVVVDFKCTTKIRGANFTYYFDTEGNILERYFKGDPLKPLN